MSLDQAIAVRMRRERRLREWTQAELGEKLTTRSGTPWSKQLVSMAEAGKRPFLVSDLVTIARVFDWDISSILAAEGEIA